MSVKHAVCALVMNWNLLYCFGLGVLMAVLSPVQAAENPANLEDIENKLDNLDTLEVEQMTFARDIRPLLVQYCWDCHDSVGQEGGVDFEMFGENPAIYQDRRLWETVLTVLQHKDMPPRRQPQPAEAERGRLLAFIEAELAKLDCDEINPGMVTLRRLNRAEYNNTIRDLIGVHFSPAEDFPSDEVGYGFDNIGDVLSLPPILLEKYLSAAEEIASAAIVARPSQNPVVKVGPKELSAEAGADLLNEREFVLLSNTEAFREHEFTYPGEYLLRVRAYGQQAGPDVARMAVRLNGDDLKQTDVPAVEGAPEEYEVQVRIEPGKHRVGVAFLNDYYQPNHPEETLRGDRNLVVHQVEIEGPLRSGPLDLPDTHRRIITCTHPRHTLDCAGPILERLAHRAYRRPVSHEEVRRLVRFVELVQQDEGTFEEGIQLALQAILVSPRFLFRWELDNFGVEEDHGTVRPLNDFELASRLSYFIWSSMPDEELFALAEQGRLSDPEVLDQQAQRMLQDPKARALVENFAGQWLQVRNLEMVSPDPGLYPDFDDSLRRAMRKETELFFETIMREGRSIMEFIDADFTYVNERLARHYGIPGIEGDSFQRVRLEAESPRGGILTQASILTLTSNPTRTSPVNRGKWILEQILGTPPPPPPPDVEELEESEEALEGGSLRQRLELHRAKAECATCHNRMDPLGFAFENFNAVGVWRDYDGRFPVDASGVLPGGQAFDGPQELKQILKEQDTFLRTVTEKMLTFALGRGLEYFDRCTVDQICDALAENEHRFPVLVAEIIKSEPFTKKQIRGE